jgi:hypothetical protein
MLIGSMHVGMLFQVFGEALAAVQSLMYRDVVVHVAASRCGLVLHLDSSSYRAEKAANGNLAIYIGDLSAEERKDLLLTLQIKPLSSASPKPLYNPTAAPRNRIKTHHVLDVRARWSFPIAFHAIV